MTLPSDPTTQRQLEQCLLPATCILIICNCDKKKVNNSQGWI